MELRVDNAFSQLTALMSLERNLHLRGGLPPTRGWAASPDFLTHAYRLATTGEVKVVLECSSGTSTVVLARAMQQQGSGHVYSLEHDPGFASLTRGHLLRLGLQDFATVIDAPLVEHELAGERWNWYATGDVPSDIDLLVIDGPPGSAQKLARYPAIPLLKSRLRTSARVILDDADRPDERQVVSRWVRDHEMARDGTPWAEKGAAILKIVSVEGKLA
jgi:predicted O-methyltransferase YrrM